MLWQSSVAGHFDCGQKNNNNGNSKNDMQMNFGWIRVKSRNIHLENVIDQRKHEYISFFDINTPLSMRSDAHPGSVLPNKGVVDCLVNFICFLILLKNESNVFFCFKNIKNNIKTAFL